jgi:hypothetical protein
MKLTRRQVTQAAPGLLSAAMLHAQQPAPAADAELQAARDRIKATANAVALVNVPMDVEPSFQFKP